ncbi:unnamed protein product [Cylicocyclus nassatus]|uniref:Uncharacterized protein n=1 Tax=Cylicocyclus nassatus TaxID=53992 RepID=A0AA36GRT2_CYLNA|nr:unnamed protein product [Cylicocyclus nassatus]
MIMLHTMTVKPWTCAKLIHLLKFKVTGEVIPPTALT